MGRSAESIEVGRRLSREAKRRRTGICEDCGATTRYNGHKGTPVSRHCVGCGNTRLAMRRRGSGPVTSKILELLSRHPMRMMEIRDEVGISNAHTGVALRRLLDYGLIERPARGWYRRAA